MKQAFPSESYEIYLGPSFLHELPPIDEWRAFKKLIQYPESMTFAELWHEKATVLNGVPLRRDFDVRELMKFGQSLILYQRTDNGRWQTTFCGDKVVEAVGFELTGKFMDEYADQDTLEFWMRNIEYICDQGKPVMEIYTLDHANKDYAICQSLNLPLRINSSCAPDMFVCHEIYGKRGASSDLKT